MYPNQLPREFRMASGGFGRMVLPFVLMLALFAVIMLALGWVFAGAAGGIGAAVVGTGALVGVLYSKFRRMKEGTVVRFSEYGVELSDQLGFHVRLGWRDMTRLGTVNTRMASPEAVGEDIKVSIGSMNSLGLIGWGDRVIPPNAPGWMRENLARQPRNPVDGRSEVAIPLGGIDSNWLHGPMGQWVRMYRPDLLGPQQPGPPQAGPLQQSGPFQQPGLPQQPGPYQQPGPSQQPQGWPQQPQGWRPH